jgi:hypothetical protein
VSLVRIVAGEPVRYSLDNGITVNEYDPGEVYSVPDWVGANMVRRGWAKVVKPEDLPAVDDDKDDAPTDVDMTALRQPKENDK